MKFWRLLDLTYALISGDHERLIAGDRHFYVAQVEVCGPPPDSAAEFLVMDLRNQTQHLAERVPHLGNPVVLRLEFNPYFYPQYPPPPRHRGERPPRPGSRMIQVTAGVFSTTTGAELGRTSLSFQYDFAPGMRYDGMRNANAINVQAQRQVDASAAEDLLERVYGTKDWDRFMHPEFSGY
jgi:hypothetical protein